MGSMAFFSLRVRLLRRMEESFIVLEISRGEKFVPESFWDGSFGMLPMFPMNVPRPLSSCHVELCEAGKQ